MTEGKKKEKKTCSYQHSVLKKPCGRKLYDDKFCIFHSNDIRGKKDKFKTAFWEEVNRQRMDESEYDFSGFVFPDQISFGACKIICEFVEFDKAVDFSHTQFSERVKFIRSHFSKNANFTFAKFSGKTDFVDNKFSGEANFYKSQFLKDADFNSAKFSGDANFSKAKFFEKANFPFTKFFERADFSLAEFSLDTKFSGTQFFKEVVFSSAKFLKNSEFNEVKFNARADFNSALFSADTLFYKAQFIEEATFRIVIFSGKTSFISAKFSKLADFFWAEFSKFTNFENIELEDCNSFKMLDTYFYEVSGLFEYVEKNRTKFKYSNKTEFLPDNFRLILGERTAARYPIISRKIKDDMHLLSFKKKHPKLHFLWWLFADCGRSIGRWALWSIGSALFFAIVYSIIGPYGFKPKPEGYTWFSFFYYSIVTFTTLGFGDITPIKWFTEILVTIEVSLGYIMLGGLISILANKLARRS